MKRVYLLLVLSVTLLILVSTTNNKSYLIIRDVKFNAEVASTNKEKEIGLSKYSSISNDFALVFPFEKPGIYSFWMKNMKFSIDIIFVNGNKIVQIYENVPYPHSQSEILPVYKPSEISNMVIETNAGTAKKYNFKKGDLVRLVK